MEMDRDKYVIEVENTFVYFLIALNKLHLSEGVMSMMLRSDTILVGFVHRNKRYLRKPDGVLVLW